MLFFFFFKQKTSYEMRISDWSSDVCSSDLAGERLAMLIPLQHLLVPAYQSITVLNGLHIAQHRLGRHLAFAIDPEMPLQIPDPQHEQIGRASCREGVCQYV